MRSDTLFLTMVGEYFDQCDTGTKKIEYRLRTKYWKSRVENPDLKRIEMRRGRRAKKGDPKNLVFEWNGYTETTIIHKLFGKDPVEVYAIPLVKL